MIVGCVLLIAAWVALVRPVVLVTASTPAASTPPDAQRPRLEHRSRGPPERIGAIRPADDAVPSCPLDPHCIEHLQHPVGRARTAPAEHP
jgi:hypothetical protein